MEIELGDKVRDNVTGAEGIAIAHTLWLNGCRRIVIQQKIDKEGKLPDAITVDIENVEIVEAQAIKNKHKHTGGPMSRSSERAAVSR